VKKINKFHAVESYLINEAFVDLKFVDLKSTNLSSRKFCRFEIDKSQSPIYFEVAIDFKSTKYSTRRFVDFKSTNFIFSK